MKKKAILTAVSLGLAGALCLGLAACGSKDNEPYYNKTYTYLGTITIDWDGKNSYDNYTQDYSKPVSQREILTKHWDKIDWERTLFQAGDIREIIEHDTIDEFIASFEEFEEKANENIKGLKVSVSGKDNPTLTLTFTEEILEVLSYVGDYDAELTMPLVESTDTPGYFGTGEYKTEGNLLLSVRFNVEKYLKNIHLSLVQSMLDEDGNTIGEAFTLLADEFSVMTLFDANGSTILDIRFWNDFTVTKNK